MVAGGCRALWTGQAIVRRFGGILRTGGETGAGRMLAKIAEMNFPEWFDMCIPSDDTRRFASPFSLKTWVAMSRNFGDDGA